jgi:NTP pyrophosphatase (non-canonical NTP hydrolase)
MIYNLSEFAKQVHALARAKGWWDKPRTLSETIANTHAELSEAWEEVRKGRAINEIYFEGKKPCGIPVELADAIIRILDFCEGFDIDIDQALCIKHRYNQTRSYRHGVKIA